MRERYAVEGEIPGRIPRVFPLVGHRDDVRVVEMCPVAIAPVAAPRGRGWLCRIPCQPFGNVEVEKLLAPDHSGECLPLDGARISACDSLLELCVELISLPDT